MRFSISIGKRNVPVYEILDTGACTPERVHSPHTYVSNVLQTIHGRKIIVLVLPASCDGLWQTAQSSFLIIEKLIEHGYVSSDVDAVVISTDDALRLILVAVEESCRSVIIIRLSRTGAAYCDERESARHDLRQRTCLPRMHLDDDGLIIIGYDGSGFSEYFREQTVAAMYYGLMDDVLSELAVDGKFVSMRSCPDIYARSIDGSMHPGIEPSDYVIMRDDMNVMFETMVDTVTLGNAHIDVSSFPDVVVSPRFVSEMNCIMCLSTSDKAVYKRNRSAFRVFKRYVAEWRRRLNGTPLSLCAVDERSLRICKGFESRSYVETMKRIWEETA